MSFIASVTLHPRLFIASFCGVVVGFVLPFSLGPLVRTITGWDVMSSLYLIFGWWMMSRCSEDSIRRRAELQDESGWTILIIAAAAAMISIGAIVGLLAGFKDLSAEMKPIYLSLAVFTIFCSWFFLHTLFTLHYAHEYYGPLPKKKAGQRGGLQFAGTPDLPTYFDFAYYSFTIGMTAQTSDTAVTTPTMRNLTLCHAILTFFFNTVILALTINIAASLI